VIYNPSNELVSDIHQLKRNLLEVRRSVWPLREVLNNLYKEETELILPKTQIYFRDVYDHVIQVIENVEMLRDTVGGLLDVYLSGVSNKMNEIMKVLTIMSTIFIPLTFIAGIYGMNFQHMPELHWKYGYPAVLLLMIAIALAMIYFFKKKKWL
ncbi:MAG: magnesium and cobalt transport protein CorA, partial [Bacteroidetes bacterium]